MLLQTFLEDADYLKAFWSGLKRESSGMVDDLLPVEERQGTLFLLVGLSVAFDRINSYPPGAFL